MAKNIAKTAEVRARTDKELETRLAELRKEQFNLRFQRATGQLSNTARVGQVRKEIARILTIAGERKRGGNQPASTAKKEKAPKAAKTKPAKPSAA